MSESQLVLPNWRIRFYYDKYLKGNPYIINQDVGINKRDVTPIEGGIYSSELGNIVDTDKDLREYSCYCGKLNSRLSYEEAKEIVNNGGYCKMMSVEQYAKKHLEQILKNMDGFI